MQNTHRLAAMVLTTVSLLPFRVEAATSDSYTLYDEYPNYAERQAAESNSYLLNEAGETWYNAPLTGPTYSIVSGPPTSSQSTSSSSATTSSAVTSQSSVTDTAGSTGGGGGGHRGDRDTTTTGQTSSVVTHSSVPQSSSKSSAPFGGVHFAPIDDSPLLGALPVSGQVSHVMGERSTDAPHFFMMTDQPDQRHASAPIVIEQPLIVTCSKSYAVTLIVLQAIIFMVLGLLYFALKRSSFVFTGIHGGYAGISRFLFWWIPIVKESDEKKKLRKNPRTPKAKSASRTKR